MPEQTSQLLKQYALGIKRIYGKNLKAVILYGSYARNDYDEDSDQDIMILVDLTEEQIRVVRQPLLVTSNDGKFDIVINVTGGGLNGQASACLHGISRALTQVDQNSHTALKANGYLTRDSRMVERKKYGQKGARRRFQFSKR